MLALKSVYELTAIFPLRASDWMLGGLSGSLNVEGGSETAWIDILKAKCGRDNTICMLVGEWEMGTLEVECQKEMRSLDGDLNNMC